jgi:hypothetical protein
LPTQVSTINQLHARRIYEQSVDRKQQRAVFGHEMGIKPRHRAQRFGLRFLQEGVFLVVGDRYFEFHKATHFYVADLPT